MRRQSRFQRNFCWGLKMSLRFRSGAIRICHELWWFARTGRISLPLIGDIQASGLNASQVAAKIAAKLAEFKENPNVSVSLKEVNSYFIFVLGEVQRPGKYPLKSYVTVLQGVSMAGGFLPFASPSQMQVIRNRTSENGKESQLRIPVPYNDLVAGKGGIGNFILKSGDTIVVP